MHLFCVGASHKTAPVALRERLAFDEPATRLALEALRERFPHAEFVIVSTCNRCEIYVARPIHQRPREEEIRQFFGQFHDLDPAEYEGSLYAFADAEAARHLFQVASGIDSLVPGEDQVLGQLKQAHKLAQSLHMINGHLGEVFQCAFAAAKAVRTQTKIASGKVSVASVAADLAVEHCGSIAWKTVLGVGAGETTSTMLKLLAKCGASKIMIANRSAARAEELAQAVGGQAVSFDGLPQALEQADVVLCSTGATDPIIRADQVRRAMAARPDQPMLIIDIAVPRDVEEAVAQVPNVKLYNIDHLKSVTEGNLSLRNLQIDACEKIVEEKVNDYFHRLHVREVVPIIEALYRQMRHTIDQEWVDARNKLTGQAEQDEQVMQRAFHRAIRRILHVPVSHLREAAGTESARQHAAALKRLFGLDDHGVLPTEGPPPDMQSHLPAVTNANLPPGHPPIDQMSQPHLPPGHPPIEKLSQPRAVPGHKPIDQMSQQPPGHSPAGSEADNLHPAAGSESAPSRTGP